MAEEIKHKVYVTHCVDVEGPMTETIEATWERIVLEDNIRINIEPTGENLKKLQNMELDLEIPEEELRYLSEKYSQQNLNYLTSWREIDREINRVIDDSFRSGHSDSLGRPYRFNWFIYDHYKFTNNPRYHAEGIHAIFDHYQDLFLNNNEYGDGIYWHYHHVPSSGDALEWNTNWWMNGIHEEILARRIIERQWFPSVFRAGGHIERNDISYWLEMFIPFDYSARTSKELNRLHGAAAVNDWRFAPYNWGYYHPNFYDYRRPGNMKRALYRCLDLRTWITAITENDVREAFEQASNGYDTVLAYYNHDFRPMADDIDYVYSLIKKVEKEYSGVEWLYEDCLTTARNLQHFGAEDKAPQFEYNIAGDLLTIESDRELFGPEPFLAIQEDDRFFRDNTAQESPNRWSYRFRKPDLVRAFGIAGNSPGGKTGLIVHEGGVR